MTLIIKGLEDLTKGADQYVTWCAALIQRCRLMKYGNQQEHIVQCDGGKYSALSLLLHVESKLIPDP